MSGVPPYFGDQLQYTIGQFYAGIADPDQIPIAFDAAARLCGAKGLLIGPLVPQTTPVPGLIAYASEVFHEAIPEYLSEFIAINPRKNWLTKHNIRDAVFSDEKLISDEEINSHPFYNEFLQKHGNMRSCDRVASGVLDTGSLWISAQYGTNSGVPDQDQRQVFQLLSGHIAHAIGLYRSLRRERARTLSFDALINAYGCAAIVVDRNACIVTMNDQARKLHGHGLSFVGGQVFATSPLHAASWQRFLREAITPSAPAAAPTLLRLVSPVDESTLLLRASPIQPSDQPASFLGANEQSRFILIIAETPGQSTGAAIERPLMMLGLTQAEARIAAMVGVGYSPDEAAEKHKITVSTARLHLRRAYDKLGINRQSELARIAAQLDKFGHRP